MACGGSMAVASSVVSASASSASSSAGSTDLTAEGIVTVEEAAGV